MKVKMTKGLAVFVLMAVFMWVGTAANAAPNLRVMRPLPVDGPYDAGPAIDPVPEDGQWFKKISTGAESAISYEFHDNVGASGGGTSGYLAIKGYIQNLQYDGQDNLIAFDILATVTNDGYYSSELLWENGTNLHSETQGAEFTNQISMDKVKLTVEFADDPAVAFPGAGSPYVGSASDIKAVNHDYLAWYCWTPEGDPADDGDYMVPAWDFGYGFIDPGESENKTLEFQVVPPAAPESDLYQKIHALEAAGADVLINRTKSVKISKYFDDILDLDNNGDTGVAYPGANDEDNSNCSVFFNAATIPCEGIPQHYVNPPGWETESKYTHQSWIFTEPGWYHQPEWSAGAIPPPPDPDPEPLCHPDCEGPEFPYGPDDGFPLTVNPYGDPLMIGAEPLFHDSFDWTWRAMGGPWSRRGLYGGHERENVVKLKFRIPNQKDRCWTKDLWIQYIVYWVKSFGSPPAYDPDNPWIEVRITTPGVDEAATRVSRIIENNGEPTCGGGSGGFWWIVTEQWEIDTQSSCEYIDLTYDLQNDAFVCLVDRIDIDTRCVPTYVGTDLDVDGLNCENDNCPNLSNAGQIDTDNDGVGDACDNCRLTDNPGQQDTNGDGYGNMCDCDVAVPNDGVVAGLDVAIFSDEWGSLGPLDTDFDSDGVVAGYDVTILCERWGQTAPFE